MCGHKFHENCILEVMEKSSNKCPICRRLINKKTPYNPTPMGGKRLKSKRKTSKRKTKRNNKYKKYKKNI